MVGKRSSRVGLAVVAVTSFLLVASPTPWATPLVGEPPYDGTVYISPEVLTPADPSDFTGRLSYHGLRAATVFDRRVDAMTRAPVHHFKAGFTCGKRQVEILVNQEFGRKQAQREARRFARVLGQLPPGVRQSVEALWIHGGDYAAGGGNRSILIHTGWFDGVSGETSMQEFVEETFLHEAAHTTLDSRPSGAQVMDPAIWKAAVQADAAFISTYARDNPDTEDVAESYGAYAAWLSASRSWPVAQDKETIQHTMPQRIRALQSLGRSFEIGARTCPVLS